MTLIVVSREGSITHAARVMRVKQSTVSRQLKKLEEILGVRLFVRTRQGVVLTLSGEKTLKHANFVLDAVQRLIQELRSVQDSPHGFVRVGSIMSAGSTLIPEVLGKLRRRYPDVTVWVQEGVSEHLEVLVSRGELDMVMVTGPVEVGTVKRQKLWDEGYVLVVPKMNRLSRKENLKVNEVMEEKIALLKSRIVLRVLEQQARARHTSLKLVMETDNLESLKSMVEADAAVAIVPEVLQQHVNGWKARVVPIRDPELRREVFLLHRGSEYLSAAARVFRDELIRETRTPAFRRQYRLT